jgi:hypothetical protein
MKGKQMLSPNALNVLATLFGRQSQMSLPVGAADEIVEIRKWVEAEALKLQAVKPKEETKKTE